LSPFARPFRRPTPLAIGVDSTSSHLQWMANSCPTKEKTRAAKRGSLHPKVANVVANRPTTSGPRGHFKLVLSP
jgi:hypothetical protein